MTLRPPPSCLSGLPWGSPGISSCHPLPLNPIQPWFFRQRIPDENVETWLWQRSGQLDPSELESLELAHSIIKRIQQHPKQRVTVRLQFVWPAWERG